MKRGSKRGMVVKNLRDLVRVSFADGLGGEEETSSSVSHCKSSCVFKGNLINYEVCCYLSLLFEEFGKEEEVRWWRGERDERKKI